MKILHLISGGDVGGAKTHVLSLVSALNRSEMVHLVCFMEGDFAQEARQLGIPTTVIEGNHLVQTCKRILAMLRHDGYQLIHCHGARANMMGMMLRRKAHIPVVSTVHSDYRLDYLGRPLAALTYGNVNKIALPRLDAWIGVSHDMTKTLISRGFDPHRVYTLYNGVDFSDDREVVSREETLAQMGFQSENVVFGIAARISPVKDMTTLIRAFASAIRRAPHIRLAIAGDGEQALQMRELAAELCPENTVYFAGWVRDIDSFYHAIDVNCLTSLSEGFPYALPEGARMKCATISSEVGGVPYLIDDGLNGLLFDPQDVDRLAEHMVLLATDEHLRTAMGQALYEKTRREFSLEAMLSKQMQIYESILRRSERSERKRDGVVICGAYGKGNRGDNAILNAIVEQLRNTDADLPVTVLTRKPIEARLCADIDSIYTFRWRKIGKRMKRSKLYISGGGTLMQDATSTRSLLYYLHSIRQASKKGCKVMLYGCGIGPIDKKRNRKRVKKILDRYADVISVRDHYSLEFLKELGVTKPEIHLTADPAILLDAPNRQTMHNYLRRCGLRKDESYVLLAVRPWHGFGEHTEDIAQAVEYVRRNYALTPILCCMEPNRDESAAKAVAEKLSGRYILLPAGDNAQEILAMMRSVKLVVAMRLHALIFASGQDIPMVGIVYDPKVSGFLDDLRLQHYLPLQECTAEALSRQIDEAMSSGISQAENIARLRALAAKNAALAAGLLCSE